MDKNEAVKRCLKCKQCEFELIEKRGLTPENEFCPIAQTVWLGEHSAAQEITTPKEKQYYCYYYAKFNGTQQDFMLPIKSPSAKEAAAQCWQQVMEKTGRHAFGVKARVKYDGTITQGYPPHK